ncbi:hypothetical protein P9X10_01380 [Bacillus cereus]|nr:hypothetical protein [Bacillus cereus]
MTEIVFQYKKNEGEEVLDLIYIHNIQGDVFVCTSEVDFYEFMNTVNANWTGNEEEDRVINGNEFKLVQYNCNKVLTKRPYADRKQVPSNASEVTGVVDGIIAVCYVAVEDEVTVIYHPRFVSDKDKIFNLKDEYFIR